MCVCIQSSQHNETCVSQMKKKQNRRSRIQATILSKFSNNSIQSIQKQLSKQPLEYFVQQQAFIYIQSYTIYIYNIYISIYIFYLCLHKNTTKQRSYERQIQLLLLLCLPPSSALETVPEDQNEHLAEQLTKLRTSLLKQQQQKQKTEHTNNNNKRNNNALQCSIATDEGGRAREAGS